MEVVIYACQIIPGDDEELHFAATLEECMRNASEILKDLRQDPDVSADELGARAVYECTLRTPDTATLIAILNEDSEAIRTCVASRKLVTIVQE
ncbi:hypothetical protein [Rhizobium sp. LC145]|jgi:hypothetical protein|uniref:hypothetical protein n=1 Tax=Rhizobium sp. LC145 TaxID=1120688 RepID=UPI000629E8A2|nr:hypothetical protein [Rhizobium sp. LC145]KKX32951.1 hypothetical protein YH62_05215 [Rhizobium sp. LC145]TKT57364.1 hypothetical protein FDR95_13885 [Rhizobiaceae bacterium LC148]